MDKKSRSNFCDLCVGIDLGTTNSVLSIINERQNGNLVSKVLDIARPDNMYNTIGGDIKLTTVKKPTLPSCVYYRQEQDYKPLVGDFAKNQYPLRPHLVAKSIKSQMGKSLVEGLSPDIPDKTPSEVAARILQHMIAEASKVYRCKITDAVITVPANFDSSMCKATLDAAEKAGIKIRNDDGTERPILLSEPNAVIYDLINQIKNGEISDHILDLSEKKRVIVFDLGGGTLDITMHEIKRREDCPEVLKVDEIATNRYTLLGGDDFDEEIAKVMYDRYVKQYSRYGSEITNKLKANKNMIFPQLRVYAEHLKLELNERCSQDFNLSCWDDDEDEEIELSTGGSMGAVGYTYDDTFTKEEVEKILSVFMADDLKFNDYKNISCIKNTRNIIYPILDVLSKASEKLNEEEVFVDAVIVNGGMSKFYMVTDRLEKFFGFEPIVALDPDQAVARGAAVYHYQMKKHQEIKDDMKVLGKDFDNASCSHKKNDEIIKPKEIVPSPSDCFIEWGSTVLNDSLYLGVKNGAVHKIIPTGAELPYTSGIMTGFKVASGQNKIAIPIKSQNIDGSYRTIAKGNISFTRSYPKGAYVAFKVEMKKNKTITMTAWTSMDESGNIQWEKGTVDITIDNTKDSRIKTKFISPEGSNLQPKEEISNLMQLYKNHEKCKKAGVKNNILKKISDCADNICKAGNKEEFSQPVLEALNNNWLSQMAKEKLFIIARKIGETWTDAEKSRLASLCINQLIWELKGLSASSTQVSANIQAIYTLSMCGSREQLESLKKLHICSRYLQACLYTHAKTSTELLWICSQFEKDAENALKGYSNHLQNSAHAVGMALRKDKEKCYDKKVITPKTEGKLAAKLCRLIKNADLPSTSLICCIIALGCILDQRKELSEVKPQIINEALEILEELNVFCDDYQSCDKSKNVAVKMIRGEILDSCEEKFLLEKLEI